MNPLPPVSHRPAAVDPEPELPVEPERRCEVARPQAGVDELHLHAGHPTLRGVAEDIVGLSRDRHPGGRRSGARVGPCDPVWPDGEIATDGPWKFKYWWPLGPRVNRALGGSPDGGPPLRAASHVGRKGDAQLEHRRRWPARGSVRAIATPGSPKRSNPDGEEPPSSRSRPRVRNGRTHVGTRPGVPFHARGVRL